MTKAELIESTYEKFEGEVTKKRVAEMVDGIFESMVVAIKKDQRFSYPGFGVFTVRKRKARKGRNPQTGESIKIKASKSVGFKASRTLKDRL